jgi:hypothetical protein
MSERKTSMYKGFKFSHAFNSKLRIVCVTKIARAIPDDGALSDFKAVLGKHQKFRELDARKE